MPHNQRGIGGNKRNVNFFTEKEKIAF